MNKDKSLNRGNCNYEDLTPLADIEREIEYENYVNMMDNLSRNREGIPLIPKHSTPFHYDTDEDIDHELLEHHEDELCADCDYDNDVNKGNQDYNSEYSDYDDDY